MIFGYLDLLFGIWKSAPISRLRVREYCWRWRVGLEKVPWGRLVCVCVLEIFNGVRKDESSATDRTGQEDGLLLKLFLKH